MSIVLALLMLVVPVKAETGRFTITQDGRRIGTEEFTISAVLGGYRAEGQMRLDGDPTVMKSRMVLDEQLNPISYEYEDARGLIRVRIEDPVSDYEQIVNGETITDNFQFPKGGFILENMFHHYVLLMYKVASGTSSLAVVTPQNRGLGSATVRPKGNRKFDLEVNGVGMEATTDADGRLIRLAIPDGKLVVER